MQQTRCAQARLIGSRMLQQTGVSMYQQHIGKQACRQVVTSAGAWRPCLALPRRRLPSMRTQPHPMRRTQPSNLPELSTLPLAAPLKAQTSENSSSASAAPASKGAQVTIVGAGPAGLATAIMLARRGYTNITVRSEGASRGLTLLLRRLTVRLPDPTLYSPLLVTHQCFRYAC